MNAYLVGLLVAAMLYFGTYAMIEATDKVMRFGIPAVLYASAIMLLLYLSGHKAP